MGANNGSQRRMKCNPDTIERLRKAIAAGNHIQTACAYVGIDRGTYYCWMHRAKQRPNTIYGEFARAMDAAQAECEVRIAAQWQQKVPEDWRAARDFLAKRFPERWGDQVRIRVEAEKAVDGVLDKLEGALPPEVYLQVLQALDKVTEEEAELEEGSED